MKKFVLAILAAMGVHKHLSAEQKQDLGNAVMQAAPGAGAAGAAKYGGMPLSDWLVILSMLFIVLQAVHLIWKWRRQALIDAEHRKINRALPQTDWGQP